jgi:hypothetical protein
MNVQKNLTCTIEAKAFRKTQGQDIIFSPGKLRIRQEQYKTATAGAVRSSAVPAIMVYEDSTPVLYLNSCVQHR